jgi:arylsulfatase A-like enzyme
MPAAHKPSPSYRATVLLALLALACASEPEPGPSSAPAAWPERPNVLLISLDTLRRDHVGAYGYERATTPALDAFAATSLRFDQAFTHHPWTLTAHATMLTGLLPRVHGVLADRALAPQVETLAEVFAEAGYATVAVVDQCHWMDPVFGHDQGFGSYQVLATGAGPKVDALFTKLDSLAAEDGPAPPFLAFAHLFDAHSDFTQLPYDAAPEHREAFAGWYAGPYDGSLPEYPDWGHSSAFLLRANELGYALEGDERRVLGDLYDAGIRTLDDQLARLFAGLEQRGLLANTVVAIVSDHGEELYDHGQALHGQSYDETLRIPFLLRTPDLERGTARSTDELVGLVDLAPTLLSLAGLRVPADMQGLDLTPLLAGQPLAAPREQLVIDNSIFLGLRTRELAAFHGPAGFGLFDLGDDPEQLVNRIDDPAYAERLGALVAEVNRLTEAMAPLKARLAPTPGSVELDDEDRADLHAIGYAE